MKLYVSGPMTGYSMFNFPAFFEMKGRLLEYGTLWGRLHGVLKGEEKIEVVLPMDWMSQDQLHDVMNTEDANAHGVPYNQCLANDLNLLLNSNITGIVAFGKWWESRGACIEVFTGLMLGMNIYHWDNSRAGTQWLKDRTIEASGYVMKGLSKQISEKVRRDPRMFIEMVDILRGRPPEGEYKARFSGMDIAKDLGDE